MKKYQAVFNVCALSLVIAAAAHADTVAPPAPVAASSLPLLSPVASPASALAEGREALIDRRYPEAIKQLILAAAGHDAPDEALLLLGHAYSEAREYRLAIDLPGFTWPTSVVMHEL